MVAAVGTVGLVGSILLFVRSLRKDRQEAEARMAAIKQLANSNVVAGAPTATLNVSRAHYNHRTGETWVHGTPTEETLRDRGYFNYPAPAAPVNVTHQHYAGTAPVYHQDNSGMNLLTGVLIGEAISSSHNHDTTVIERATHSHSDTDYTPFLPSSGGDNGFTYSDSTPSSNDSSGGFDISW